MRIAFIIQNAWPLVGGSEKVCLRIGQQLLKEKHEPRILTRFTENRVGLSEYFRKSENDHVFDNEGVETHIIGINTFTKLLWSPLYKLIWRPSSFPIAKALYNFGMSGKLKRLCKNVDLIHYFGNGPEMLGFAAQSVSQSLKRPFFIEPALHHGQWGDGWIDEKLYKQATCLLAHTEFEKSVLINMGIEESKIEVISHGIDFQTNGNGERFRRRHGISGKMVLFLGRKTESKGVSLTVKAFQSLIQKSPEITLVLAGPASEKTAFGAPQNVLDLDNLEESEKQDALAACDVLCVPSEGESFGMVYFEAWAYCKPVIALDLPSLVETIGRSEGGILVERSVDSVATAIEFILSNSLEAKEMGKRGFELAKKHDWQNAINTYLKGYNRFYQARH